MLSLRYVCGVFTTGLVTLTGSLLEQFLCTAISKVFKPTMSLVWRCTFWVFILICFVRSLRECTKRVYGIQKYFEVWGNKLTLNNV